MVTIPRQFNGPNDSGNGGWVCGLVADQWHEAHGPGIVEATLRQPPPLESPLVWQHDGDVVRLMSAGGALIAEGRPGALADGDPPAVTASEAERGRESFAGFQHHPYEHCFTCGPRRADGDGLRLFAGRVTDGVAAATWQAHAAFDAGDGAVSTPVTWAAIDCSGAWATLDHGPLPPMLLGRMSGTVHRRPQVGEPMIATGWLRERDGRKLHTSTALTSVDGELLARSDQVWLTVAAAPAATLAQRE